MMTEDDDEYPCDLCGKKLETYSVMIAPHFVIHATCAIRDGNEMIDWDATRATLQGLEQ